MSQIYKNLMRAEREKQRSSNERSVSRIFEPEKVKMEQGTAISSLREKIGALKLTEGQGDKRLMEEQNTHAGSLFFFRLANSIKANLNVIKTLADLSQGKFKDIEFENNFIKTVDEYVHGTHSGLDCFFDYLKVRSPIRKRDIVHSILEEILDGNKEKFKDKKIQVVKKFEKGLPETSIPDEHLRYILNWVVQYASFSVSPNGSIGLLTRSFNFQEVKDDSQSFLKKDRKYIEIIIFLTSYEKVNEPSEAELGARALMRENQNDFILPLVEEITRMNGGIIRVKGDHKKHWSQILLILPV